MNEELQYSRLDSAFSKFLTQRTVFNKQQQSVFEALIAKLSFQQSQGHSCIQLDEAEQMLVCDSGLASETDLTPLILEQSRLYLYRYWFYENRLAVQLKCLLKHACINNDYEPLLARYFVELIDEIDWQREATKKALTQAFCIITGGPGTGKTTTVVKILSILQELAIKEGGALHIALATPTGKAAMRLQESIGSNKKTLPCSEAIKRQIPEVVTTLHRLLGVRPSSPYFKHDSNNPLVYDLVVVDEASMVDLALMSKLVDALKPGSRLILLGDKDQLASVEAGAVLADLTAVLPENTVELKKSHRFKGAIKALAEAVNQQKVDDAWRLLEADSEQIGLLKSDLIEYIAKQYQPYLKKIKNNADFNLIFSAFSQFQVLCSNRHTERGVVEINKHVEAKLAQQNAIQITGQWYVGRPVMVTQNNSSMQLYNGDIGLCLYDSVSLANRVFFLRPDGSVKKVLPSRMPAHETVFAMTIHKSQGSEFDECLCVLPHEINPVLTKELIYTAITRAKIKLRIVSDYAIFSETLRQSVLRTGGLSKKLEGK